jgi:hypothetical protein
MPNDPQNNPMSKDIRTVWQSQTREPSNVSLELIRYKAQQLEGAIRHQAVGVYVVMLGIVAASLYISWRVDQIFIRIGAAVLVLWALSLAYQARKGVWPGRLAPDATLKVSLDFYRQELERHRFYLRAAGKALWPVLLSAALFLTLPAREAMRKPGLFVNLLPFTILMVAWAVALFLTVRRKLRAVQREVDELDVLDKGR